MMRKMSLNNYRHSQLTASLDIALRIMGAIDEYRYLWVQNLPRRSPFGFIGSNYGYSQTGEPPNSDAINWLPAKLNPSNRLMGSI